jgi:indole-3-glycerol phosphate synthase
MSQQTGMPDILQRIIKRKWEQIEERRAAVDQAEIERQAALVLPPRGFAAAIAHAVEHGQPAVIAEIKRASPSKGVIRDPFDPVAIARSYEAAGATCLSILTDEEFFGGASEYLTAAREATALPVLRKEFIVDPYQVWEARVIGADAILLIVSALNDEQLASLTRLANELGMDVLVEVHDSEELERAIKLLPLHPLIGINNRNLRTFEVSLQTTIDLSVRLRNETIIVTESGIASREDVGLMRSHGVDAFLVGESLMRADDPGERLAELFFADNRPEAE